MLNATTEAPYGVFMFLPEEPLTPPLSSRGRVSELRSLRNEYRGPGLLQRFVRRPFTRRGLWLRPRRPAARSAGQLEARRQTGWHLALAVVLAGRLDESLHRRREPLLVGRGDHGTLVRVKNHIPLHVGRPTHRPHFEPDASTRDAALRRC